MIFIKIKYVEEIIKQANTKPSQNFIERSEKAGDLLKKLKGKEIIYNKLIRDNIPDVINSNFTYHIANTEEYKIALFEKVKEELQEFIETPNVEEMADILEVIEAIINLFELDFEEIISFKNNKRNEKGAFDKRIILESVGGE